MVKKRKLSKKKKIKVSSAFLTSLAVISIIGFIVIILEAFTDFEIIGSLASNLLLVVLGVGLIVEGQYKVFLKKFKGGLKPSEITPRIVTLSIGLVALVVGILSFIIPDSLIFDSTKAIVSVVAIFMIAIETWVVK